MGAADEAVARAVESAMSRISTSVDDEAVAQDVKRHLDDLRESQDVAERRTQITLDAVQATLSAWRTGSGSSRPSSGIRACRPIPSAY